MPGVREHTILNEIRTAAMRVGPRLQGRRIVLFGSRALGTARTRSDFDIGIVGDTPAPASLFYEFEDALDDIHTLYTIDLVDLAAAGRHFREHALKKCEVLYG